MPVQFALINVTWPKQGVTGAVTAVVTAPAGGEPVQTLAATLSSPTGMPTVWFTPQTVGTYTLAWSSTGGQTESVPVVVTAAAAQQSVITIQDCYATLKMPPAQIGVDTVRDADMLAYARAAVGIVESISGPVASATVTQVFDGRGTALLLRAKPRSIQAVTAGGNPVTGWTCDFTAGILFNDAGWPAGRRNIAVTYAVGSGLVAPNIMLGIRELDRQLWERSRAMGGAATVDTVMQGFAVPNAVYELLAPTAAYPGFA